MIKWGCNKGNFGCENTRHGQNGKYCPVKQRSGARAVPYDGEFIKCRDCGFYVATICMIGTISAMESFTCQSCAYNDFGHKVEGKKKTILCVRICGKIISKTKTKQKKRI